VVRELVVWLVHYGISVTEKVAIGIYDLEFCCAVSAGASLMSSNKC
jgi:hypothetical protein